MELRIALASLYLFSAYTLAFADETLTLNVEDYARSGIRLDFPAIFVYDKTGAPAVSSIGNDDDGGVNAYLMSPTTNAMAKHADDFSKFESALKAAHIDFRSLVSNRSDVTIFTVQPDAAIGICPPCREQDEKLSRIAAQMKPLKVDLRHVTLFSNKPKK